MNIIQIILVLIVAFLAGVEGILDQWEIHQPLVACTLIGLIAGQLNLGVILGGTLQLIAIGWANIGAAVAPDVALASVASSIILIESGLGQQGIGIAVAFAVIISLIGLWLTHIVRTISNNIVKQMDQAAKNGNWHRINRLQWGGITLQGCRIMLPALVMLLIPNSVYASLSLLPSWLIAGFAIAAGMVTCVGFAAIVNMMGNKETWPFFAIGFALAGVTNLTLIALVALGAGGMLLYLTLEGRIGGKLSNKTINN